jgi:hypothetical protein
MYTSDLEGRLVRADLRTAPTLEERAGAAGFAQVLFGNSQYPSRERLAKRLGVHVNQVNHSVWAAYMAGRERGKA